MSYRLEGERRRLSLLGHEVAYRIERDEVVLSRANGEVRLDWHVIPGSGVEAWLEVSNVGQAPIQLDELAVVLVDAAQGGVVEPGSPSRWRFYQNGWQSWSPALARRAGDGTYVELDSALYLNRHLPHSPLGAASALRHRCQPAGPLRQRDPAAPLPFPSRRNSAAG